MTQGLIYHLQESVSNVAESYANPLTPNFRLCPFMAIAAGKRICEKQGHAANDAISRAIMDGDGKA